MSSRLEPDELSSPYYTGNLQKELEVPTQEDILYDRCQYLEQKVDELQFDKDGLIKELRQIKLEKKE